MTNRGIFVAGTDTDVGKTEVAVAIVRQLTQAGMRVGVYKPVATGGADDSRRLWDAAGRPLSLDAVGPQVFRLPISPPRSARAEGRTVDERLLVDGFMAWRAASDVVVVEGAGGLFSPLGETLLNVDLAAILALPVVIVDAGRLGSIGRTLATVAAAQSRGLTVAAVVLSQTAPGETPTGAGPASAERIFLDSASDLAARLAPIPVATLAHGAALIQPAIDWRALC